VPKTDNFIITSHFAFTWRGGLNPFRHVRLFVSPFGPGCLSGAFCAYNGLHSTTNHFQILPGHADKKAYPAYPYLPSLPRRRRAVRYSLELILVVQTCGWMPFLMPVSVNFFLSSSTDCLLWHVMCNCNSVEEIWIRGFVGDVCRPATVISQQWQQQKMMVTASPTSAGIVFVVLSRLFYSVFFALEIIGSRDLCPDLQNMLRFIIRSS